MRKMRNSVKAIIIAICTVVVAVSATLGIILLNKNKGKNPAPEYALTQAQKNLVAEINQNALKEQAKNQNNLQVFDSMIFRDGVGDSINTATVSDFTENYFAVQQTQDSYDVYLYSQGQSGIETVDFLSYVEENDLLDSKYTSVECGKYFGSSDEETNYFVLKATYNDNGTEKYDLVVYCLNDSVTLLNTIPWNGYSAYIFGFSENYYIYLYTVRPDEEDYSDWYLDVSLFSYDDSAVSLNVRHYAINDAGVGLKSFAKNYFLIPTKTKYSFYYLTNEGFTENTFEINEEYSYTYETFDFGTVITKVDEQSEKTEYLFYNPKTQKTYNLNFSDGYLYHSIKNISENHFCLVEKEKDEGSFKFTYFNDSCSEVISYKADYEDAYILFAKNNEIISKYAVISTKSCVNADIISSFGAKDDAYYVLSESYDPNLSYFVVDSNKGMNFASYKGKLLFEESYPNIYSYNGEFLIHDSEEYYSVDVQSGTLERVYNVSEYTTNNLTDGGLNLISNGYYVNYYQNQYSFHKFNGEIVKFNSKFGEVSKFTSLNLTKDEYSGFVFVEAITTNNELVILYFFDSKEFELQEEGSDPYTHTAVTYLAEKWGSYSTSYSCSASEKFCGLGTDDGSATVSVSKSGSGMSASRSWTSTTWVLFMGDNDDLKFSVTCSASAGQTSLSFSGVQLFSFWKDFAYHSTSMDSASASGSDVKLNTKVQNKQTSGSYTWKPSSVSYTNKGSAVTVEYATNCVDGTSGSITGADKNGSDFTEASSSTQLFITNDGSFLITSYLSSGKLWNTHYYRYPSFKEASYTIVYKTKPYRLSGAAINTSSKVKNSTASADFTEDDYSIPYTKKLSAVTGATPPTVTLEGYVFKGWTVGTSSGATILSGDSSKLGGSGATKNLYPRFEPADVNVYFNYLSQNNVTTSASTYDVFIKKTLNPISNINNYKLRGVKITSSTLSVGGTAYGSTKLYYDSEYTIWVATDTTSKYMTKTNLAIHPDEDNDIQNVTGSSNQFSGSAQKYFTDGGTYVVSKESRSIKGDDGLKIEVATATKTYIPTSNKWFQNFKASYDPSSSTKLTATSFFSSSGSPQDDFKKTCKPANIEVKGQGLQFKSWLLEVNPSGSEANYFMTIDNPSLSTTMYNYIYGTKSGNSYPNSVSGGVLEIAVYALYEERDYDVKTDSSNEVYGSSELTTAEKTTLDDKLIDYTTLINYSKSESAVQINKSPAKIKFMDSVNINIYLNGETASVSDKEAYYVFDKVEIQNYGYRVWVSNNGSTFNYVYGYCTIRFVLSALNPRTWSVEFINKTPTVLNGMTHYYNSSGVKTAFGTTNNDEKFQKLVHKSEFGNGSTYYVRDGKTGATQFNIVNISSSTETSFVFSVSTCGNTGEYTDSGNTFTVTESTVKSKTGGFKVVAYPKSNYLPKDSISINTGSSSGVGSVLGLAIQTLSSVSSTEMKFWINNIEYKTEAATSGFYRLDNKNVDGKITKTSDYNFENSKITNSAGTVVTNYVDVVYVYKHPTVAAKSYVYYPSYLVESTYGTGTTINSSTVRNWETDVETSSPTPSVIKNFNYENMRMFVVRPEQVKLSTSSKPTNKTLSTTDYELTSYLSAIKIGSTTVTLKAERTAKTQAVNSHNTTVYDVLRMTPSSNDSGGYMYPQPTASPVVSFDNSGKISYCGKDYVIQSAFKKTIDTKSIITGTTRVVWVYLVKAEDGEYFYFVYADIDGIKSGNANNLNFEFTFAQFNKTLTLNVDDQSDLYNSTSNHNSLSYRVINYANEMTLASSGNEYGTKVSGKGYEFGTEFYYKTYGDLTDSKLLKKETYSFNPSSLMILEFVPCSGYLISEFKLKLKNSALGSANLFTLTLDDLTPSIVNGDFYYTTTDGPSAEQNFKPMITYTHTGQMFNAYYEDSAYNGIYCTQNKNDNWVQYFSSDPFKMEHIYVVIAGAYDDVQIDIKTVSYSEFVFEDTDSGALLGFDNSSSNKITSGVSYLKGDVYSVKSLTNLDILLCDNGTWFKLGSGTKNGAKDAYVSKSGNYYRVVLLGKAQYLRSGVKIFATGGDYSYYLTDARFYNDLDSTNQNSILNAFDVIKRSGAEFTGRAGDDKSLYKAGNSANSTLADVEATPSLNFDQTTLADDVKLTYLYIKNVLKAHAFNEWKTTSKSGSGSTTFNSRLIGSYSSKTASKEYERSNKYVMVFTIEKNEVKFSTNSYLYNNTITEKYGNSLEDETDTWVSGFEATGSYNASTATKLYHDTTNNRLWRYKGSDIAGYQLDYVGKLYDPTGNEIGNYKKESSWFNDTILTNIDYEYNVDADTRRYPNWQDVAGSYGKHTYTVSGYDIKFTYRNVPGYYLQFFEINTVDFGSIYVPVAQITAASERRVVYSTAATAVGITIDVTFSDGIYTIILYDDGAGYTGDAVLNKQINSLGILNNNFTVNFYSRSYEYGIYLNPNTGEASTSDDVVAWNNDGSSQYEWGNYDSSKVIGSHIPVYYDSLNYIGAYLEMPGYTFIGWGSKKYDSTNDRYNKTTNTWNTSSSWLPVHSYFADDDATRTKLIGDLSAKSFGYDFYVKASSKSAYERELSTGYFITDTGFSDTENYNFWSVYAESFMATIDSRKPAATKPILTCLYGIWKPNVYTLTFEANDKNASTPNGSTIHSLEINSGKFGLGETVNYHFNDSFIVGNLGFQQNGVNTKTYYCYVTFDDNDWFITESAVVAAEMTSYDDYFAVASSTGYGKVYGDQNKLAIAGSTQSNLLNVIIDRYGYSWLGWFTKTKANANVSTSATTNTQWLIFNSEYFNKNSKGTIRKELPILGKAKDCTESSFNVSAVTNVNSTAVDANKSCVDYRWFATKNEPYSEFVYVGENKINTSILKTRTMTDPDGNSGSTYLIAFYNYKYSRTPFAPASGNTYGYSAIDFLNNNSGNSRRAQTAKLNNTSYSSVEDTYLTFFDTSLSYDCYSIVKSNSGDYTTIKIVRNNDNRSKIRTLTLYACWETNRYDIVIEWRDEETIKDDYALGSTEAGILQSDGSINKDALGPAYFDDAELADRLNKFNPVRVGYDFVGWTYLYDLYEGAVNNPTILLKDNIETMYYLNDSILTKLKWNNVITRPIFTDAGLVNSTNFAGRQETFGDTETMTSHTIYVFALWKAQTFTINIDLNIQAEELENLYEKDSNFAIALYEASRSGGSKTVNYQKSTGVRTNYYKYDSNNYAEIVANLNFVVTFDGNFADAYCQIVRGSDTYTYYLEELFAVSTGYYLLGWMLNSTDPNTLFVANGLYSAFGTDGSIVNLEDSTSNLISGYEVFNYDNYQKLYNSNYKAGLNSHETGKYGSHKEVFNNNNVDQLSVIDGAGFSSNFGFVQIGSKKYYITCEDVPVENAPTKHYLYFKYEGVKYYVVYYYLKPIGGENNDSIQLVNDHEFLYYIEDGFQYKIRFDSDGHPYTVTDKITYKDRIDFNTTIRIAIYREKTNVLSENNNCLNKHMTISNVGYKSIGYTFDHDLATATDPKPLYFDLETTRQFTLYAHWKNKGDMFVDIDNANNVLLNAEGQPNSTSNPGLAGFYDVWNTYSNAVRTGTIKYDKSFILENTKATSTSQNDEGIRLTYNYYDDLFININPYYSGRYLSEMTFIFYGIEEAIYGDVADRERSTFKLQTYRLVIDFDWDSVNHKIVIAQGGFNLYIGTDANARSISISETTSDGNQIIYNIFANAEAFSKMSLIDKYSCGTAANSFFTLFKYGTYYDKEDINQVSFQLKNVMSSIEIDCKYSVQTYEIDFYNIKHNAENALYIKEGTTNEYVTPFTPDDIKPESAIIDENPFMSSSATTHQYLATISTDCSSNVIQGYNVPYGFYIYGVYYNSPYKPYRPIDEVGSIGIPTNVVELLKDPMYGFEYIYSHGYYNYGATSKQVKQADANDNYSAQCSGVLGATTVFNDSIGIRLSGLSFYAFGGWYEYYEDNGKVVFVGYNKVAESTYINRNITLYGYYYATNEPTNIQFYTWDKDNMNYAEYTGNTEQYTLNENTEKTNYMQVGGYMTLKEGQTNYVDNDGRVKIISYLQYGVDKTAFGTHNYTNSFIMEGSNDENVLSMILDTYWYYEDSYNPLYFLDGGNNRKYIRYDKDSSQFYYLSNEADLGSSRVIVKVQTSDMTNFFLEASGPYNGKKLEFSKSDKLYTSHYGTEYNFSGTNLYAKVNKTGIGDRYYVLHHIDDSYFDGSNPHYKSWMSSKLPKYYLDVEGSRYYMILKNTSGMSKASAFYDANGNEVTASESPVRSATLTTIKNYYVNYQGYLFKINYKQNLDDGGSTYINPFVNPQTNTTTITLLSGEEVECYFNYETKVLYEKLIVKTDSFTYYIKVNKANISDVDKYYKVMSVDPSYYDRFEDDTWAFINKPAYCVDIAGTRYYITSLSTSLGASDIANDQVIYTAQGDNGGPLTGRTICRLNDYYVEYKGVKYFIEYKVIDGYVNPFIDATTNIVKVMIATNTYETCYFDYNTKTLYADVKASFDNKIYCAVNENYRINAVLKTDVWLIDNITIKLLPSPNIGFWYNGEQYGFVGYIEMNKDIFDEMTKKVDAGGGGESGAGAIYLEFSELVTAVYTKDAFASGRFATPELYTAFLNGRSFDEAYDDFVFNLREQIGTRISEYSMDDFLSDLLTADDYKYVDGNTTSINYIVVNIPVTFNDLIIDPRTGKQISLSVIAQHQFNIISTNTVVDTKISAIPIYSPFEMEFTETSYVSSGDSKSIQIDTEEMQVWHFELSSNSTHVYNKPNGDYLNFVVLNLEQYAELKLNSSNIADYLTHMINVGKYVKKYSETGGSSLVNVNSSELGDGEYVLLSYYNKTGIDIEANKYIVRVSDNMLYLDIDSGVIDSELVRTNNFQP